MFQSLIITIFSIGLIILNIGGIMHDLSRK